MSMKKVVFLFVISLCVFAGCQQEVFFEGSREVLISFSAPSLSSSLLKSTVSTEEESIENILLYGVDDQGNVIQDFLVENLLSNDFKLTISKKVKSIYAIANPSSDLITSSPPNLSDLTDLTDNFANLPQPPFLMGGKGDVNGYNVQIKLFRSVAKIEIISQNEFQITSVTVKNSPDEVYVFRKETPSTPVSASMIDHETVTSAEPVLYVSENSALNPTQFLVTGTYLGKQSNYTIVLKAENVPIDIARNTHYQVNISAITDMNCSATVTIPQWNDGIADNQIITLPNPYKDGIKILAIGNSYAENSMRYMYDLLTKFGVTSNIKLVNAYIPGGSLNQHATNAINNTNTGLYRQEYFANGVDVITNPNSLFDLIKEDKWDVITLQQSSWESGNSLSYNDDLIYLITYVNTNMTHNSNFKFGWHMTWAWANDDYPDWSTSYYIDQADMYTKICSTVKTEIVPKGFDFIIPNGTAIQNYRGLHGDVLNIYDGTHLNNLGHYIATAIWIKTITGYDISNLPVPYSNPLHYCAGPAITIDVILRGQIAQAVNDAFVLPGYK